MPTTHTPGTEVKFTQHGRKGVQTGVLNGYAYVESFGTMAFIRTSLGVVSVSVERVL